MASLPTIYTIQASDAPQHTDKLREILKELETENRIEGFTTLGVGDDLLSMSHTLKKDDMILILLTNELEEKREQVKKKVDTLKSNQPGLRIAEILVDNIMFDNEFVTFPDDLHPIRTREDMDEAWSNIARSLRDIFPVKKKKKKVKPLPQWILFVVLGVLLFGALLIFLLPTGSGGETEETFKRVPDLAGMSETEAVSLLLDAGLEAGQRSVESHETVNRDLVIQSEPNAGESVNKGDQVSLILSSGREQVRVPELTGLTLDRARAVLEGVGLRIGQHRVETHETLTSDLVIRSEPNAGEFIEQGAQVNLIYSIAAADLANVDAVRRDIAQIATAAQDYYMKPKMLGGGGRSFEDISFYRFAFPADGINDDGTVAQNENGRYVISGVIQGEFTITAHPSSRQNYAPGDLEIIPFHGLGDEDYELTSLGTDGANPLEAIILPNELEWVDAGTGTHNSGT